MMSRPEAVTQRSRNDDVGTGRMAKKPISSTEVSATGPAARYVDAEPACGGKIWPSTASAVISISMVRSAVA